MLYSDSLVRPDMTVQVEPSETSPRRLLEELLEPYGLRLRSGPGGSWLVVRDRTTVMRGRLRGRVRQESGEAVDAAVELRIGGRRPRVPVDTEGHFETELPAGRYSVSATAPGYATRRFDDVVVTPDGVTELAIELQRPVLRESVVVNATAPARDEIDPPWSLDAEELSRAPHQADDAVQVLARTPGTADSDLSAGLNVRGGHQDEVMLMLDGLELFDPVHLQDIEGGRLGLIGAESTGRIDFFTGGIPVRYGNNLSGVIEVESPTPSGPARHSLTASTGYGSLSSQGRFDDERGQWFASARVGAPEALLPSWMPETQYDPRYGDALVRLGYRVLPRSTLAGNFLYSVDETATYQDLDAFNPGEQAGVGSHYGNRYAWVTLSTAWTDDLSTRVVLSGGELDRSRQVRSEDDLGVQDTRDVELGGLTLDSSWIVGERHRVQWGAGLRRLRAHYRYNAQDLDPNDPARPESLRLDPDGLESFAYLSDTWKLGKDVALEAGLRWDAETYTGLDEDHLSPRLQASYSPTPRTTLRAAVSRLFQAQRIHELQVGDGIESFAPAESADQASIGMDRVLTKDSSMTVSVYRKRVHDVRPRYENLFDPSEFLPEAAADRVLVAPDRSELHGVELSFKGAPSSVFSWTLSYALAEAEDTIDGEDVPRSWDQRHAADLGLLFGLPRGLSLALGGSYHSGRPTTPVSTTSQDGEQVLVPGARNSGRLDAYYRVDLRIAQTFQSGRHHVDLFLDATNLLDRANVCCVAAFDVVPDGAGGFVTRPIERTGLSRTFEGGVRWQF